MKTAEQVFNKNAKEIMLTWFYNGFKRRFKTLHKVIMQSMEEYANEKVETALIKKKPRELSKEDLLKYQDFCTVGRLKKFFEDHQMSDDAKVVVQRVEDFYYENNGWGVYKKEGQHSYDAREWNEDIKSGKYLNKEQYPDMKEENLVPLTEEQINDFMEQYHPVFCPVFYKEDGDILFLDLHY